MVSTFAAGRRLKLGPTGWREPGELVPEAHTWPRIDSYLHTGYLKTVQVEETELRAAVAAFCPELEHQIAGPPEPPGPPGPVAGQIYTAPRRRKKTRRAAAG